MMGDHVRIQTTDSLRHSVEVEHELGCMTMLLLLFLGMGVISSLEKVAKAILGE